MRSHRWKRKQVYMLLDRPSQCQDFKNFRDEASLIDLGFSGNPYTWENAREGASMIRERLDGSLEKAKWLETFSHTKVLHLPRTYSDQSPIGVALDNPIVNGSFPLRCKEVWLEHPNFSYYVTSNWDSPNHQFTKGRDSF